jgi:PIN domain nuclease of toxin-antitoxin system
VQVLYARKRLELPLPFPDWLARAANDRMISVMPLSVEAVLALDALPASFRGDPTGR